MDTGQEFDRYRYKTRVQIVAVLDILVGTIPFIKLASAFHDKDLADIQEREYLVLAWMAVLSVYALQLIMGVWLLAATQECGAQYLVGNCEAWIRIGIFTFLFYIAEMSYDVSEIWKTRTKRTIPSVILTLSYHAAKIIYRAITLMTVNNYVYDVCRPVYRYLSQDDLYKSHYFLLHSKFSRAKNVAKLWHFPPDRFKPTAEYEQTSLTIVEENETGKDHPKLMNHLGPNVMPNYTEAPTTSTAGGNIGHDTENRVIATNPKVVNVDLTHPTVPELTPRVPNHRVDMGHSNNSEMNPRVLNHRVDMGHSNNPEVNPRVPNHRVDHMRHSSTEINPRVPNHRVDMGHPNVSEMNPRVPNQRVNIGHQNIPDIDSGVVDNNHRENIRHHPNSPTLFPRDEFRHNSLSHSPQRSNHIGRHIYYSYPQPRLKPYDESNRFTPNSYPP